MKQTPNEVFAMLRQCGQSFAPLQLLGCVPLLIRRAVHLYGLIPYVSILDGKLTGTSICN